MSQRRKVRREFVERDGNGNITRIADNVAVYVMEVGAEFKASGTITSTPANFETVHPGRVDAGSQCFILRSDGTMESGTIQCDSRTLNGSGIWVLELKTISGGDVGVSAGDRLVHTNTGTNRFATLYTSDTRDSLFSGTRFVDSSSTDPPSGALKVDDNGVLEFYTDETDVDMVVVDADDVSVRYGVISDTFTGRTEDTIVPGDWGDQVNEAGDSWPAIKTAIEYAEDERDRRVVLHIPAGTYRISGPLTINESGVELWMDKDTTIAAHSSWSSVNRALIEVTGTRVSIHGGVLAVPDNNSGIELVDADSSDINGVRFQGGSSGIQVKSSDAVVINQCEFYGQSVYGIFMSGSSGCHFINNHFYESGGPAAVYVVPNGVVTRNNIVSDNIFRAANSTSTGWAIWLNALDTSPTLARANTIDGNNIDSYGDGGILVNYTADTHITNNTISFVGGTNSGARDLKDGIRLNSPLACVISGNTVQQCNGKGLSMSDPDAGADSCEGCVVTGNNFRNNAEEGIYAYYSDRCIINGNYVVANSSGAAATFDIDLGTAFADGILVANMIGTGGLQISIGALSTLELGHNVEL